MKNAKGQEVQWVLEEDMLAYAKEKWPPEKYAEFEAWYKQYREEHKPKPREISVKDSEGRIVSSVTVEHSCHVEMPMEMITDPWTGQPRVFTEEEKAKYRLASRGWSPESREQVASFECKICNRLFREHSWQEFDDCQGQIEAPTVHLFAKGKRAKKETIARSKCEICSRIFGDHSQQEFDACINQSMKRHKPKREDMRYVKCEICGSRFGDHSPEKFDACVDQIIENSV
jgi:hypothetical protein